MAPRIKFNPDAERELAKRFIATEGVARMQRVANACNAQAGLKDGYRVSIEGSNPLIKHDFRATVITATAAAIRDNAKNNTLVKNFHLASGS